MNLFDPTNVQCKSTLAAYCGTEHSFRDRLEEEYLQKMKSVQRARRGAAINAWPIISGLSSFLIDRFKQELLVPIIAQIKEKICGQKEVGMVLRQTCEYFEHGKVDISSGSLALLVEALRQDLLVLPLNLLRVVEKNTFHARLLEKLVTELVKQVRNGHPKLPSLLDAVADSLELTPEPNDVERILAVAALLRLIGASAETDPTVFVDTTVKLLEEAGISLSSKLPKWRVTLSSVPGAAHRVENAIRRISSSVARNGNLPAEVVATAARDLSWIVLAVLEPHWNSTSFSLERLKNVISSVTEAVVLMAASEYEKGALVLTKLIPELTRNCEEKAIKSLNKVLLGLVPLAIDLARSKTAEGVKKALESAAAPVGTWRLKRRSHMISLGALVGVNGGFELPVRPSQAEKTLTFGVFASVGIDFSWRCMATDKCPSTLGVFLSVIDIGAVLSYHHSLEDDPTIDTEKTPKISWAQVFSPGLYLRWGACMTPLVVGAGVSLAPRLLSVKKTETGDVNTEQRTERTVLRFLAFLAVDIPVLELWSGEPVSD
jgi:hypothetical protein